MSSANTRKENVAPKAGKRTKQPNGAALPAPKRKRVAPSAEVQAETELLPSGSSGSEWQQDWSSSSEDWEEGYSGRRRRSGRTLPKS